MKSKLILTSLLTIICLSLAACGSLDPNPASNSIAFFPPRVTGMWKTSETGPIPLGSWGKPKSDLAPYPNPTNSELVINFPVPMSNTEVSMWFVKALGPYDDESSFSSTGGATVSVSGASSITTVIKNTLDYGNHTATISFAELPGGFYTVYLSIGDTLQQADILVIHTVQDIPFYLRDFVGD